MDLVKPVLAILPPSQLELWPQLSNIPQEFILYGGTSIALQLGHRQSVDFDFFSSRSFQPDALAKKLAFLNIASFLQYQPDTLTILTTHKVKLSFFGGLGFGRVRRPLLIAESKVRVASLLDMLAIKLKVLLQRVESKDYLDIVAICHSSVRLETGLSAACALFGETFPSAEALKALTYFEGGDLDTLDGATRETLIKLAKSSGGAVKACAKESPVLEE